jgi:hypothetical protein
VPSRAAPPGGSTAEAVERANRSISSSTCDCEWSEQTITAWSSRKASARRGVHQPLDLPVGRGQRVDLRVRPVLVRVRVVVGQREQQEVEQVVLDQVRADAAACWSRIPGRPSCERQPSARREDVGVEELARAADALAEDRAAIRVSAVSVDGSWRWRPRYIRYVVPAVRTPASSSVSNTVGVACERCSAFML